MDTITHQSLKEAILTHFTMLKHFDEFISILSKDGQVYLGDRPLRRLTDSFQKLNNRTKNKLGAYLHASVKGNLESILCGLVLCEQYQISGCRDSRQIIKDLKLCERRIDTPRSALDELMQRLMTWVPPDNPKIRHLLYIASSPQFLSHKSTHSGSDEALYAIGVLNLHEVSDQLRQIRKTRIFEKRKSGAIFPRGDLVSEIVLEGGGYISIQYAFTQHKQDWAYKGAIFLSSLSTSSYPEIANRAFKGNFYQLRQDFTKVKKDLGNYYGDIVSVELRQEVYDYYFQNLSLSEMVKFSNEQSCLVADLISSV